LRIGFIGSSLVSCYWNGAATYYRGLLRALAARGHEITFLEPDAFGRQANRDIPDPDWARVVVWPATPEGMARALDEAGAADLVVKASGWACSTGSSRRRSSPCAGPATSSPSGTSTRPPRSTGPRPIPPTRSGPWRGATTSSSPTAAATRWCGPTAGWARACVPVYNALDPATHHPVPPDPRFAGTDLGFLGNRLPDREARVEEFSSRRRRLPGRRFLLGGAGWGDKAGCPRTSATSATSARPTTTRSTPRASRCSTSTARAWPATASRRRPGLRGGGGGALPGHRRLGGVEAFLEPGREVLVARDGAEVAAHVAGLDPARARAIGAAALRRVLAGHTYDRRAALVEAVLEGRRLPRGGEAAA
jgi:hypothetical protein